MPSSVIRGRHRWGSRGAPWEITTTWRNLAEKPENDPRGARTRLVGQRLHCQPAPKQPINGSIVWRREWSPWLPRPHQYWPRSTARSHQICGDQPREKLPVNVCPSLINGHDMVIQVLSRDFLTSEYTDYIKELTRSFLTGWTHNSDRNWSRACRRKKSRENQTKGGPTPELRGSHTHTKGGPALHPSQGWSHTRAEACTLEPWAACTPKPRVVPHPSQAGPRTQGKGGPASGLKGTTHLSRGGSPHPDRECPKI